MLIIILLEKVKNLYNFEWMNECQMCQNYCLIYISRMNKDFWWVWISRITAIRMILIYLLTDTFVKWFVKFIITDYFAFNKNKL